VDQNDSKVVVEMKWYQKIGEFMAQLYGVFCGADNKLSGRRIIGTAFLVAGLFDLLRVATRPWPEEITVWVLAYALGPGVVITAVGLWMWQWISEQNIKSIAEGLGK
jgi:hypothetical protein